MLFDRILSLSLDEVHNSRSRFFPVRNVLDAGGVSFREFCKVAGRQISALEGIRNQPHHIRATIKLNSWINESFGILIHQRLQVFNLLKRICGTTICHKHKSDSFLVNIFGSNFINFWESWAKASSSTLITYLWNLYRARRRSLIYDPSWRSKVDYCYKRIWNVSDFIHIFLEGPHQISPRVPTHRSRLI